MSLNMNKPNVLLVEDNAVSQKVLTYFLKKLGFRIDLASTGQQALHSAFEEDYFAMILDLGLPDTDGEQVISMIRERELETGKHLPIIIVTAHMDTRAFSQSENLQKADDAFTKPVTLPKLKQCLDKIKMQYPRRSRHSSSFNGHRERRRHTFTDL